MLDGVVFHLLPIGLQPFPLTVFVGRDGVSVAIEVNFVFALEVTVWLDFFELVLRDRERGTFALAGHTAFDLQEIVFILLLFLLTLLLSLILLFLFLVLSLLFIFLLLFGCISLLLLQFFHLLLQA